MTVAVPRAPPADPAMAGFENAFDAVARLAEAAPGFVWRLSTGGHAAAAPPVHRGRTPRSVIGRRPCARLAPSVPCARSRSPATSRAPRAKTSSAAKPMSSPTPGSG
ncbi:DUF3291 domain-containing protein [Amycolatopsis sp. NBRC 101858]|uniref:DUF3291 domain-containing protein n=1 Tax=Amycolatopsis sp. NBRC 101858 TaxID=3032200 RepID=UPI003339CED5